MKALKEVMKWAIILEVFTLGLLFVLVVAKAGVYGQSVTEAAKSFVTGNSFIRDASHGGGLPPFVFPLIFGGFIGLLQWLVSAHETERTTSSHQSSKYYSRRKVIHRRKIPRP